MVALDGSDDAMAALEWAGTLPLSEADEVVLVSVVEPDSGLERRARRRHERHLALLLDESWRVRREAAAALLADAAAGTAPRAARVRQVVLEGHPVPEIARLADAAAPAILVVGARGRGRVPALVLGSVARGLLGRAHVPIVIARRPIVPPDPVLLAIDGSANADAAVACAAELPWIARSSITVLVVAPGHRPWARRPEGGPAGGSRRSGADDAAQGAVAALSRAGRAAAIAVRRGEAAPAIIEEARRVGAALIVVGARGGGGFAGLLLGGTADRVVSTSPGTVMVVPSAAVSGSEPPLPG